MSTLQQVIQEEISNILQKADNVDISDRNRKDRMQPADSKKASKDHWYKNESSEKNVRDQLRQIVAEEYETLREEPETSIEHRSGIRDFEVPDGNSDRWYVNEDGEPDTDKIEEVAKKMTNRVLREQEGLGSFSDRAAEARNKDALISIALEMKNMMGVEKFNEEMIQGMGKDELREMISYLDRMHGLSNQSPPGETLRARAEDSARDSRALYELAKEVERLLGPEEFTLAMLKQMGRSNLENSITYIDRMHNLNQPPSRYEQPIGRSMR